jgi:uncharacterized membrane protein YhaH (DUF805 family)
MKTAESLSSAPWPISSWLPNLFGFQAPVRQRDYALFGCVLMLLKYVVELIAIVALTGQTYTPLDFVNPLLVGRQKFTDAAPEWFGMAWLIWTLPFLWIALSMSVRRTAAVGFSPWLGLLVLVPVVNLLGMAALALIPDSWGKPLTAEELADAQALNDAFQPPLTDARLEHPFKSPVNPSSAIVAALTGLAGGAIFLVVFVIGSVYLLDSYGAVMFFGTPVVTGAIASFFLNTPVPRPFLATLGHGLLTLTVACCAFLFLGLEGAICIIMAIPIMVPLGLLGTCVGFAIAIGMRSTMHDERRGLLGVVLLLPLFGVAESWLQPTPTFVNMTAVEINAPPAVVWDHVVQFSEIEAPPAWYFRMGIASPQRARIEGTGVGAIRHCEFTTGDFVEPITAWEPPQRLAFDVREQPEPMFELSPYRHVHPPHLNGSFRSLKGEFRLLPLANGGTRLEGRTWYQVRIYPLAYWTLWTDAVIHRIHERVLKHIQLTAERSVHP